jgi:hypothetical protein
MLRKRVSRPYACVGLADDVDKAYRAGVFHLESLRLRREKVQQSALQVISLAYLVDGS